MLSCRSPRMLVALVSALLLAACASAARPAPPEPALGADAFFPSRPGADAYVSPPPVAAPDDDPLRRALAAESARAAADSRLPAPERDARLDQAADDIARGSREGDPYALGLVAFLLGHYGIVETEPRLTIVRASPGTDAELVHHFAPELPAILRRGPGRRLGIGVHRAQ